MATSELDHVKATALAAIRREWAIADARDEAYRAHVKAVVDEYVAALKAAQENDAKLVQFERPRQRLEDRVTPHVLRHTLATVLLNQGAPLAAVQSILGHTKPETTQLYATLSGSARQRAYERYFVQ